MADCEGKSSQASYLKAKDLRVVTKFEKDNSSEGQLRSAQAKTIICELIYLGRKRGRPVRKKENVDEAS